MSTKGMPPRPAPPPPPRPKRTEVRWLRPAEVAKLIAVSESALSRWRMEGKGPRWSKVSRRMVVYAIADVQEWIDSTARQAEQPVRESTSQPKSHGLSFDTEVQVVLAALDGVAAQLRQLSLAVADLKRRHGERR